MKHHFGLNPQPIEALTGPTGAGILAGVVQRLGLPEEGGEHVQRFVPRDPEDPGGRFRISAKAPRPEKLVRRFSKKFLKSVQKPGVDVVDRGFFKFESLRKCGSPRYSEAIHGMEAGCPLLLQGAHEIREKLFSQFQLVE